MTINSPEKKIYRDIDDVVSEIGLMCVVLVNGTFDTLHSGHIRLLNYAASLGDILVVLTNTDASIRKLKGPNRPIYPLKDRMYMLASLQCVDYVVPFKEKRVTKYLKILQPDIWVKGSDYIGCINPIELKVANELDIDISLYDSKINCSSTEVLNKLKETY